MTEQSHHEVHHYPGKRPSVEEDRGLQSKAPEQVLNGPRGEVVQSAAVSRVKNELSVLQ